MRVGWLVEPGFGPVDPEVAATVQAAAEALQSTGAIVEPVRIPALEKDFAVDVFNALQVMEIKPAFADFFRGYDALLTAVLPIPAHEHGATEFVINGQTVPATFIQGATVPLNLTGLLGLSMRFGTSSEGLPIGVQLVSAWLAESTVLHLAAQLETLSPVRDLHPDL